jgi:hypothetical protein
MLLITVNISDLKPQSMQSLQHEITLPSCSFVHSFIYFAFRQSIQVHKQPKGYRTFHIANAI